MEEGLKPVFFIASALSFLGVGGVQVTSKCIKMYSIVKVWNSDLNTTASEGPLQPFPEVDGGGGWASLNPGLRYFHFRGG